MRQQPTVVVEFRVHPRGRRLRVRTYVHNAHARAEAAGWIVLDVHLATPDERKIKYVHELGDEDY